MLLIILNFPHVTIHVFINSNCYNVKAMKSQQLIVIILFDFLILRTITNHIHVYMFMQLHTCTTYFQEIIISIQVNHEYIIISSCMYMLI